MSKAISKILIALVFVGCSIRSNEYNYALYDIELFKEESSRLADAVAKQDTSLIRYLLEKKPELLNYQEPKYGQTLLMWAINQDKLESTRVLLGLGFDPNIKRYNDSISSVILAASNISSCEYLELVLDFGGDPNIIANGEKRVQEPTPLIAASCNHFECFKMLIENGANVNQSQGIHSPSGWSALCKNVKNVHFLIFNTDVDFKSPIINYSEGNERYLVDVMRNWNFELDSKEYQLKMEIVEYLNKNGIDYRNAKVPKVIQQNYSKDYIDVY